MMMGMGLALRYLYFVDQMCIVSLSTQVFS